MESVRTDGAILPASGTLLAYEPPSGPGVRTDGFGYAGYETSLAFDSLLAKVVGHSPSADFGDAVRRTSRALAEFRIEGVETNVAFLQAILAHPDFVAGRVHTRFVDEHIAELAAAGEPPRFVTPSGHDHARAEDGFAGARVDDARDPLALFKHDTKVKSAQSEPDASQPTGPVALPAPAPGTVVAVAVAEGDEVPAGAPMATINALELHHVVRALHQCTVDAVFVAADDAIGAGDPLFLVTDSEAEGSWAEPTTEVDPDARRSDLAQVDARRAYTDDDFRAEKIARRHAKQQRSPRENIEHLMDGTFREYGPLVTAASWQKQQWLRETTQADGLVMGIGHINGDLFEADRSRAVAVHYDYMVVAGTQAAGGTTSRIGSMNSPGATGCPWCCSPRAAGAVPASAAASAPRSPTSPWRPDCASRATILPDPAPGRWTSPAAVAAASPSTPIRSPSSASSVVSSPWSASIPADASRATR